MIQYHTKTDILPTLLSTVFQSPTLFSSKSQYHLTYSLDLFNKNYNVDLKPSRGTSVCRNLWSSKMHDSEVQRPTQKNEALLLKINVNVGNTIFNVKCVSRYSKALVQNIDKCNESTHVHSFSCHMTISQDM